MIDHNYEVNPSAENKPVVNGLIVSAGFSSRMKAFKPLLDYEGKSFLLNIIEKISPVCREIILVTGFKSEIVESHLKEHAKKNETIFRCVCNKEYKNGMFSSIQTGIKEIKQSDWILYHMVDQPNLPTKFYIDFIKQLNIDYDWIQPSFNSKKGHPILFNSKMVNEILSADKFTNLRTISSSREFKKRYWNCNYPEIFTDIDTPIDFEKLNNKG